MVQAISILIPAYNESATIKTTIESLKKLQDIYEVIVVDDGSTDETGLLAEKAGAKVFYLDKNYGKGEALNFGALKTRGEIIVLLDADLGYSAAEAVKLWEPIIQDKADVVIAAFPPPKRRGGFGIVKKLAYWGVIFLGGKPLNWSLSGQRAFTKKALEGVLPFAGGYGAEVITTIKLLKSNYRVKEVEVEMTHRETGRNLAGFLHRGRQFGHILKALIKEAVKCS